MIKQHLYPVTSSIMLPHYPLYIGLQSPQSHSHLPLPLARRSLLLTVGSRHLVSGGREGAGSRIGQSVVSSRDICSYNNLSAVEVGLLVMCLCQRFDGHSST